MSENGNDSTRRNYLQTSLAVGTGLLAGCIFGGSSNDDGVAPTTTERSEPAGTPPRRTITDQRNQSRLQWSVSVGDAIKPRATLEENDANLLLGTSDGNVVSLSTDDGSEQWSVSSDSLGQISRGPVVTDGYFGIGSPSGQVGLYDLATHEEYWETQINGGGVIDSLGIADSTLYAGWHRVIEEGDTETVEAATFAFGFDSADERWKTSISGGVADICVTDSDGVYIGGEQVVELSPSDGTASWAVEFENDGFTQGITCAGSTVYASTSSSIAAVSQSGTHDWETPLDGGASYRPAVASDYVFTTAGEDIVAVARDSGDIQWRGMIDGHFLGVTAPLRVVDETVYVGASEGVWALNRTDGSVHWWYETGGSDIVDMIVHDSSIFAADADGTVYRIRIGQ